MKGSQKAYVSSQRDREIVVLDIRALPTIRLLTRIPLPGQPNKMILNRDGSRLFVTQDNADTVVTAQVAANDHFLPTSEGPIPPAGESFTTRRSAGNLEVLRGVSFTPGTAK